MPKVTLAFPWEGHDAGEQVDVDDEVAAILYRGGRAAPPEPAKAKQGK